MSNALLGGSALAAYLAGMVAFFAPCCAFVMLPTYIASVAEASRIRVAALTVVFIAGVATVVLPLTAGAAGLSQLLAANHTTMFVIGGIVMIAVGAATVSGWMWHHAPSAGASSSGVFGVYTTGVFAGAATACCAPVLAGAVTIAGLSSAWWVGALLGMIYLFGLVSPLLLWAVGLGALQRRLRDPAVSVRVAGRRITTTLSRLVGGTMFLAIGTVLIVLAASGKSRSAPSFQQAIGRWLSGRANQITDVVPAAVGWVVVAALAVFAIRAAVRALRRPTPAAAPLSSAHHDCCATADASGDATTP